MPSLSLEGGGIFHISSNYDIFTVPKTTRRPFSPSVTSRNLADIPKRIIITHQEIAEGNHRYIYEEDDWERVSTPRLTLHPVSPDYSPDAAHDLMGSIGAMI